MASSIAELFGKSPIKPIQQHMEKVRSCVAKLEDFLEATFANDWDRADTLQQEINRIETEADELKNKLRSNLPYNLLMPFARSDVIALLAMQDRLANKAKDVAGIMLGRKMAVPAPLIPSFREFYLLSLDAAKQAEKVINELDELLETGFRGREVGYVKSLIGTLGDAEQKSDESQVKLRARLMALEDSLPPVAVMFLYQVIELIGGIADVSERVGNRLTLLLSK